MDHRTFVSNTIGKAWARERVTSLVDMLSLDDIAELLNTPSSSAIPYRNGDVVPDGEYRANVPGKDVDVHWLYRHMASKQSAVLNSVDRYSASVARFARDVQDSLPYPSGTWTNLYISFDDVQCLGQHVDPTEIYVLQLHGTKRWIMGDRSLDLEPGDMLYVPKGLAHSAMCVSKCSVHLTVAVRPFTMQDYLDAASRHIVLSDEPVLSADHARTMLVDFFAQLSAVNAESVLEQARRRSHLFDMTKTEKLDFRELMR